MTAAEKEALLKRLSGTLIERLGISFEHIGPERVTATMPVEGNTQPFGLLHGGASVALAETLASVGALCHVDKESEQVVGIEINANHIRSARDGLVRGEGIPVHSGKSTHVWEVKIYDKADKLVCISRCTLATVR